MARDINFLDEFVATFRHYRMAHRLNESKAELTITFNSDRDKWEFIDQLRHDMRPEAGFRTPPFYGRDTEVVQGIALTLKVADKGFY